MPHDFDFAEWLTEFNHGELNQQLGERLKEVAAAVSETQKAGEIVLKISIKEAGRKALVTPEIKSKVPKDAAPSAMFYFRDDGSLTPHDPKQLAISFTAMGVRDNTPKG